MEKTPGGVSKIVADKLSELKSKGWIKDRESMESIVGDLNFYLERRKEVRGGKASPMDMKSDQYLYDVIDPDYKDFSDSELSELINQLSKE